MGEPPLKIAGHWPVIFFDNENRLFYNCKINLQHLENYFGLLLIEGHLPINVYIQLTSGIIRVVMHFE